MTLTAVSPSVSGGVSKAQLLATRAPYYWGWLKTLPYGVARRITRGKCRGYEVMEPRLTDKCGLEIGGPSPIFCGNKLIPVYDRCRQMDNANFCQHTIWDRGEPSLQPGFGFARQYVAEAGDLSPIPGGTYDFVLAAHVLEHVANPLRALHEWRRVLRPAGAMLVIVPDRRATFDHRRAPTGFDHIASDFRNGTSEEDTTHLDEILALHDLALDPGAGTAAQFQERCHRNFSVRAMHHHVFVPEVLVRMFSKVEMRLLTLAIERPCHIIAFAQKVDHAEGESTAPQNLTLLEENADWRKHDPLRKAGPRSEGC
jgi:SAM-dependent methyltransferase